MNNIIASFNKYLNTNFSGIVPLKNYYHNSIITFFDKFIQINSLQKYDIELIKELCQIYNEIINITNISTTINIKIITFIFYNDTINKYYNYLSYVKNQLETNRERFYNSLEPDLQDNYILLLIYNELRNVVIRSDYDITSIDFKTFNIESYILFWNKFFKDNELYSLFFKKMFSRLKAADISKFNVQGDCSNLTFNITKNEEVSKIGGNLMTNNLNSRYKYY